MSGTALGLVLAAALCHAIWNIAAKRVRGDGYVFVWWYDVWSAIVWVPVGLVILARAGWPWSWGLLYAPLVSAVAHIAYQLFLQTGYDKADLGVVYPVARGVGPLLTMAVALLAFQERPGWLGVLGGLVIIAGIVVVATGRGSAHRHRTADGILWGGLTGAAIAAYTLWDDHAVTTLALLPVTYFAFGTLWQAVLMAPGLRRHREAGLVAVLRRYRWEVGIVAILSPFAYILVLEAMRTTPVALVAPARESSIVVGSLLAWWLFKEPNPVRKLVGAAVVLSGIALIVA
ncbi:EamA family transporter [Calidifontibacter sp. DB0510]|uniref:EamA family transporter n=1 Tax=Metallococcus carri TaxID=1656884 RepID=A0A967AZH6_9MICO|nr:EamA family transporter [Metallococcus carri]NHN55224.1 EamA family transporter [Metallococcus carri]NOP36301.1 EamA family transporter [Calidifontibacter sp. DB2511S]